MLPKEYNFSEFEKITKEHWLEKASSELKGKSLDSLNWKVGNDEFTPFFTKDDISEMPDLVVGNSQPWLNIQRFDKCDDNFEKASIDALNNGADGVIVKVTSETDLAKRIEKILPEHCQLSFASEENSLNISQAYFSLLNERSTVKEKIKGFGMWHEIVQLDLNEKRFNFEADILSKIIENNEYPNFKNALIDTTLFSTDESSPSNEVGFALAMLVYTINELISCGLEFEQIASNIFFRLKSKTQYFVEIAKIKALRTLVREIFSQYDKKIAFRSIVHVDVDSGVENGYLQNTTQAMSSILGGADSISVMTNNDSSQDVRISRNISSIIKEEAYFDKIQDPASGSYFIDRLTHDIAKNSWNVFVDIERGGGFAESVKSGLLNQLITNDINAVEK